MTKIFCLAAATLIFSAPAMAQALVDKCFQGDWLQQNHSVIFRIKGTHVSGYFTVRNDDDQETEYDFTGKKNGNSITVKFVGGKIPDIAPSEIKNFVWTLAPKAGAEVLRIKVYGKNYTTNKYENGTAEYRACPVLRAMTMEEMAKPVAFAKGTSSAKESISFSNDNQQKIFSLNVRKGQTLDIVALGCTITVYQPDKKLFYRLENPGSPDSGKSSVALDMMSIKPLPQTGNYLIVIKNAGSDPAAARDVEFKVSK